MRHLRTFATALLIVAFVIAYLFVADKKIVAVPAHSTQPEPTPPALSGNCEVTWCTYAAEYVLPMSATWAADALSFSWESPPKDGSGVERGHGHVVLPATTRHFRADGRWEMMQVIANTYTPGGSPSCCCEYVSGPQGSDFPITLSDYCGTPGVDNLSHACSADMIAQLACPSNNASAIEKWGLPYSEEYSKCDQEIVFVM